MVLTSHSAKKQPDTQFSRELKTPIKYKNIYNIAFNTELK